MKLSKKIKILSLVTGTAMASSLVIGLAVANQNEESKVESLVTNFSSTTTTTDTTTDTTTEKATPIDQTELSRNATYMASEVPAAIVAIITRINTIINEELRSINESTTLSVEEKFERGFYISKVRNYLDNNADEIKKNPRDWGFWIVFPMIYAENLKVNIGTVSWNGKSANGFSFGSTPATSYAAAEFDFSDALSVNRTENVNEIDNIVTNDKLQELWTNYRGELDKNAISFIVNANDQPKLGTDYTIHVEYTENGAVFTGSEPTIEGYKTWDDYIKAKIGKRTLDFDITQNLQNNTQEPAVIPVPPNDTDSDIGLPGEEIITVPSTFEIRDIKDLNPLATVSTINLSAGDFVTIYNSSTDENKKKLYWFDNPMNSRFSYDVAEVKLSSDKTKVEATVTITDLVNTENQRSYTVDNAFDNLGDSNNITRWRYLSYLTLQAQMKAILDIFNVNDVFDYSKLSAFQQNNIKIIRDTVYALTKIVFTNKFETQREELINAYSKLNYKNNAEQFQIEIQTLLLSWMNNTIVIQDVNNPSSQISLVNYMAKVTTNRVADITSAYIKNASEIEKILPNFNLTSSDIALAFARLNQEVKLINKLAWNDNNLRSQFASWSETSDVIDTIISPLEAIFEQLTTPNSDVKVNQAIGQEIKDINNENADVNQALIIGFSSASGAITLVGLIGIALRFGIKRRS